MLIDLPIYKNLPNWLFCELGFFRQPLIVGCRFFLIETMILLGLYDEKSNHFKHYLFGFNMY
jgi:hypothetical protein